MRSRLIESQSLAAVIVFATGLLFLLPVRSATRGEEVTASASSTKNFELSRHDVVAFIGGAAVVAQGELGHLESLLAAAYLDIGIRFRNLGREGDTVFDQPRDVNFPSLFEQLKSTRATVIFVQFGDAESVAGPARLPAFVAAYERMCDRLAKITPRLVFVTPTGGAGKRDEQVRPYAVAVRQIAERRGYVCTDVSNIADSDADVAGAIIRSLGLTNAVNLAGGANARGQWKSPAMEAVRQAVVEKNRLWFEYSRPMNWAFLGGDRQFVPSSRDPDDLKVRIFPREMQKYVALIEKADAKIDELAQVAANEGRPK